MTVNDRVLVAAARILDETGKRPDAEAVRSQAGVDADVTAAIRDLAALGYVQIIDMWQGAVVLGITPQGRQRLAEMTPKAKARRFAAYAADRLVWPVVGGVSLAVVLLYFGLK